ncbi:MAG TPA: Gfo/Idh/MocA family oxidoreductase [Chthonomonadaceae bacterium]|nr:Gfo/Idh/MocA family oxidoreductase [Chthonomonadaceae bacterium]
MIRVGLVDFDTSHVEAFTQRLNHLDVPESEWVEGAKVVAGCPGDSDIMPERIPGYTEKLRGYGVELVERPGDLFGKIDAVMIESQQGSRHLERARPFLEAGVPTYVDKPFAPDVEQAEAMIALAEKHNTPLMSCSSLRYDPKVAEALAKRSEYGRLLSADVWGSAATHEGNPGLLHYGIHAVEILYALMGPGCRQVQACISEQGEAVIGLWSSGHVGVYRGLREGSGGFGFTAHYEKGHFPTIVDGAACYREMLKVVVQMFETRKPPIEYATMREIIAFIQAARESKAQGGAVVKLP